MTRIRAKFVAAEAALDSDAATYISARGLRRAAPRRAISDTIAAIKASATLTWADIAIWPFSDQYNAASGSTFYPLGGWTAALQNGICTREDLVRMTDPRGLWTNTGGTNTNITNLIISNLPLTADYAVLDFARFYGNPQSGRAIGSVAGNSFSRSQSSAQQWLLAGDFDGAFTRNIYASQLNASGWIQDTNGGSPRAIALGENGVQRNLASVNVYGTTNLYTGTHFISGDSYNYISNEAPVIVFEAKAVMKNPSPAKWRALEALMKANFFPVDTTTQDYFGLYGQSQSSNEPRAFWTN